jgi:hypothetical protein
MQDLIQKVTQASGVTQEQAAKAIETVSAYLKQRVPDVFKSQIDTLVNGGTLSEGMKMKINEAAGDFRDKAEEVIEEVRQKTENIISEAREKFAQMFSQKKDGEK